ncbi:MAG: M61 family metallopeptidase [Bradymonadaceae bacterium]
MTPIIRYIVSAPVPSDHLFHVRMEIDGLGTLEELELCMPVWSPGSYLVREYGRHVQNLRVRDGAGGERRVRKHQKSGWMVECEGAERLVAEYEVFAHDLTVRTNHLDDSHGLYNGVALYLYPPAFMDAVLALEVDAPDGWEVYCGLDPVEGEPHCFEAPDYDVLFDAPVEMGPEHDVLDFEALGVPHRLVVWGRGSYDKEKLARDLPPIIEANAATFSGDLPYKRYLIILHLTDAGYGGLEHLNSTVLLYARHQLQDDGVSDSDEGIDEKYTNFLRLVCHEHFHVWNVKRIRPAVLGPFDYQSENYTRELWSIEGVTSYYDTLNLVRAEISDGKDYLKRLAKRIQAYDCIPGRHLQALEDSSFDAWIKLYRPDENTLNSTISYYLKGELVSWLLDLWMRRVTGGRESLDSVMRHLWAAFGVSPEAGYAEGAYEEIVESITDANAGKFFEDYVRGTRDPDWNEFLAPFGLKLLKEYEKKEPGPWLGLRVNDDGGRASVAYVPSKSPAHVASIFAGDELVALDGWKVTASNLSELVAKYRPEENVEVHVFRRGELMSRAVTLGRTPPDKYRFVLRSDAGPEERRLLKGWLGTDSIDEEDKAEETS